MSAEVLPGFEDEAREAEAARQRLIESQRLAASDPSLDGPDSKGRHTLTRTHPWEDADGEMHRAVTVIFTPAEWAVVETAVLADLGLVRGGRP